MKHKLYKGDCLKVMDELIENNIKVDAIITDIPQEITKNSWDNVIPFKEMWNKLYKLRKNKNTPIILFTNQPFTTHLIYSNLKHFKIMKYWQKDRPSGFLNAKRMPLKDIEEIAVFQEEDSCTILEEVAIFYEKQPTYNPTMVKGKENHSIGKVEGEDFCKNNNNYGNFSRVNTKGDLKYPRQLMVYPRPHPPIHPTQKPIELLEDLIKTYSNEDEIILDFTMGSNSTGIACLNTNRNYIGIEKDDTYFNLAKERTEKHILGNNLQAELEFFM